MTFQESRSPEQGAQDGTEQQAPEQKAAEQPSPESSDPSIPASERGKEEERFLEDREPTAVFGLVAGSYLVILIGALLIIAAVVWWTW